MSIQGILKNCLTRGIPLDPLPSLVAPSPSVPHAPKRTPKLSPAEFKLAIKNALRYFPTSFHSQLAQEFAEELKTEGHIYMRRFKPTEYQMKAYPIDYYPAQCQSGACMMLMIQNNLDPAVAQFPEELITYGGNGSVFSNWAQYHLTMYYLSKLTDEQTLTMYSGHPMGLFPSPRSGPRAVITNGMVIPNYSSPKDYDRMYAQGVSQYGQMTAGSYCYIGPQGIVHGTTITILNAARKFLKTDDLHGVVYVSSGLGGMSGAQPKAGVVCGAISVTAEVDEVALNKRHAQGWVQEKTDNLDACIERIKRARKEKKPLSLGYLGNVVDLWERLGEEKELLVDLGSDQTSLHNPFGGGYYPAGVSFKEGQKILVSDPKRFESMVKETLIRHVAAINKLTARGMKFWDYGNSFLLQASRAGADILNKDSSFRYPSYVQDFMGDVFSLGFGPFRWVCTSGLPEDLRLTDSIAEKVMKKLLVSAPPPVAQQLRDNLLWIEQAEGHKLVVGSQARILYADAAGRMQIAEAINHAIQEGKLKGPVVLSRDHHDVSGTDSPYRETSNIYDGSSFCADMSVHNVIGDSFRGASWVALHNGGGVGWGEVMNGGFGLVLDGTEEAKGRARNMLFWDVNNGVARRAWAGNENASLAIQRSLDEFPNFKLTVPIRASESVIDKAYSSVFPSKL